MATTVAPFQPGLASAGSSNTALTTTGGGNANAGGALATFTPGMDVQNNPGYSNGGGAASGPLASMQQMMQQPSPSR